MKNNHLARFFKVRAGEGRTALLLTSLMVLLFAGLYIGSPGVESLFLTRFGFESLPYMFIALGLATSLVTVFISTVMQRLQQKLLYRILPLFLALVLGVSRFLISLDYAWLYPILYLCIYIFWTVQNLFAWGTAAMVYDTRQAKRLFPLLGAGGILGSAAGGLVTKPLVRLLGAANLILIWAGALVIGALIIDRLLRGAGPRGAGLRGAVRSGGTSAGSFAATTAARRKLHRNGGIFESVRQGYRYVISSSFMRRLSLAAVFFGIIYFMLVFPFSREATLQFPDADRLAGFLGLFQGVAMAVGFLLSLLVANRLFARIGFVPSIWVLSFIYLAGFILVSIFPIFPALIGFRFVQMSWTLGIATTALQATFNIAPQQRREQTRMFVTGITRQLGISAAGAVLIVLRSLFPQHTIYLAGAMLSALALTAILLAGRAYRQALVEALRAGRPDIFIPEKQPFGGEFRDERAASVVLAGISSKDPGLRRISAELLGSLRLPRAESALITALADPDAEVRASVLIALGNTGSTAALLEISVLLQDPVAEVRLQALRQLRRLSPYSGGLRIQLRPLLEDPEPTVRAGAAAVLLDTGAAEGAERVLKELLGAADSYESIAALRACAEWGGRPALRLAEQRLQDRDPIIRSEALRAVAGIDPQGSVPALIRALGDPSRSVVATAVTLIHQADGNALPDLLEALEEPDLEAGALQALRFFPTRQLQGIQRLHSFARRKVEEIAHYRALMQHSRRLPLAGNGQLTVALKEKLLQSGIRALSAAGLLSDPGSAAAAIEELNSTNGDQRANALEILDGLKDREIVRQALPLFEQGVEGDSGDPTDRLGAVQHTSARPSSSDPANLLLAVMADADPWLRASAAYSVVDGTQDARVRARLERLTEDEDPLVRETAVRVLNGEQKMSNLSALSTLERIISLKRVPLFTHFAPSELKQVAAICRERELAEGDVLGVQGEIGQEMYIILAGQVRILDDEIDGKELARRGPGEYVGEMAVISREPRMATMVASGEVRILSISQPEFEQILRQCPDASLAVMRVLCDRLRESRSAQQNRHSGLQRAFRSAGT